MPICDPPGRGKRHSQERRVWKEDIWNQDWSGDGTGWRKNKYVFSGSDTGIQEELGDVCGDPIVRKTDSRLNKGEDVVYSVFTGSKDRECDRESREDHGKRKGPEGQITRIRKGRQLYVVDKYR